MGRLISVAGLYRVAAPFIRQDGLLYLLLSSLPDDPVTSSFSRPMVAT